MRIGVSLPVREMQDDLGAIKAFAQAAEDLGLTHLRVPEQVIRPSNNHLHEAMTILAYIAAVTSKVELVPSVIIVPLRQTALLAKQAAQLDILTNGRTRLGVGVGNSREEYAAMGVDFSTRGPRCDEQMSVLKKLWMEKTVTFSGEFHTLEKLGINPLPVQRPIPMWIGSGSRPPKSIIRRIGQHADGWFVMSDPEEYQLVLAEINASAEKAGRDPSEIGAEAGVAVVGPREAEWQSRVKNWHDVGLTHLCLRTLGGDLKVDDHISVLTRVMGELPV
ncbi:MAG: LLM class F420-dependent oxidoreductase [Gammaproteobacteria bacterium]|nr:LLM class F420-dependent oxidoreductase [Gammaproteobacteria bacterium]